MPLAEGRVRGARDRLVVDPVVARFDRQGVHVDVAFGVGIVEASAEGEGVRF